MIKIKLTLERSYQVNPDNYPKGASFDDMLKIDIENFKDDPWLFLDSDDDIIVTGEVIE